MKLLFIIAVLFLAPICTKAQAPTIGKTKQQIRNLVSPGSAIKLVKGDDCDTLILQADMVMVMYYKNDICYTSKSTMPLKYMSYVTDRMTHDAYKKSDDHTWINAAGTIKVVITILKEKDQFVTVTSQADKTIRN